MSREAVRLSIVQTEHLALALPTHAYPPSRTRRCAVYDIAVVVLMYRAVERCTFDQARLIRHNRILAKNGIAPDGERPELHRAIDTD